MLYHSFSTFKMLLSILTIILSLAPQSRAAPSPTASASAATYSVNVGADGLTFEPDTVVANVGDIILFRFYPQNHSVARSDYMSPCIPYELTGAGRVGFWSGFEPINVVLSNPPTFSLLVNDTSPIFFYCSAPGACKDNQMVGVINPNSTQTLATQKAFAANSTLQLSPGQSFPAEGAPSQTSAPKSSTSSSSTLTGGAIAGIAIGGAALLVVAAALLYFCGRQRTAKEILQTQSISGPMPYHPPSENMSLASSAGYLPKYQRVSIAPLNFSGQGGLYDHPVGIDSASYRSRSPPADESRDMNLLSQMNWPASPGLMSPPRSASPQMRPPPMSPTRPRRPSQSQTVSSYSEGLIYQPMKTDVATALSFYRAPSQTGPHELSSENESPRPFPPARNPRRDSNASKPTLNDF